MFFFKKKIALKIQIREMETWLCGFFSKKYHDILNW